MLQQISGYLGAQASKPNFTQLQPRKTGGGGPSFHEVPLEVSWLLLIDLAVLIVAFRWQKYSYYIHVLFGLVVIGLTLGATIPLLMNSFLYRQKDKTMMKVHKTIGFIIVIWMGVQGITGIISRVIQYSPKIKPNVVKCIKMVHNSSGYLLMILAKFNYLSVKWVDGKLKTSFILLLLADIGLVIIYLWLKFAYWTMASQTCDPQTKLSNKEVQKLQQQKQNQIEYLQTRTPIVNRQNQTKNQNGNSFDEVPSKFDSRKIQTIENKGKLKVPFIQYTQTKYYSEKLIPLENYVLFNDFVYDISNFGGRHPGGEKLIRLMNKREISRFMIGSYSAELTPNVKAWNHSKDSMRLVGPPVAMIERSSPVKGLDDYNKVTIKEKLLVSNSANPTFLITLKKEPSNNLLWTGFSDQSQIGQFFSLTISNRKGWKRVTRLYTTIWCMRPQNLALLKNHFPELQRQLDERNQAINQRKNENQDVLAQISGEIMMKPVPSEEEVVPLVLKKYKKGELTSKLLDDGFDGELILSKTLGAGMKYSELKEEGKVIIICGGTGLLPFCDFIDLLFKRVLLLENNVMAEKCAVHDFVVREDLIKKRNFKLYCAAESETDLLPLTLFQMEHLSKSTKIMFEAVFRLRSGEDRFKAKYPNLMTQKEYFNEKVTADLKYGSVCQIYICGSPEMNASMGQIMQENKVSSESYHFM